MKEKRRLYLIDATAFCYRAFYALGNLATSYGQPTNAVYGFTNMLNKILKDKDPAYIAVCFDVSRDTFRQKKFTEYKLNRPPMPEGLSGQMPLIKQVINAYKIPIFEKEGFEADDVMATLSRMAKEQGMPVTIVSSDKDIFQLIDDNTEVFSPYKDEGTIYDARKVVERFGISPELIPDMIALMGDSVDNIPSVPGIGEKTAINLVKQFGTVEKLLASFSEVKQEKLRASIQAHKDLIKLNKELAVLDKNIGFDFKPEALARGTPDYNELFRLFKLFEFNRLIKDIPVEGSVIEKQKLCEITDAKAGPYIDKCETLYLYGLAEDMIFKCGKQAFCMTQMGENIRSILSDPLVRKAGFDLKKTKVALATQGICLEGLSFDIMIAAHLLNPSRSEYTIDSIAWDHLKEAVRPEQIDDQKAIELISRLEPVLKKELKEKSLYGLFNDTEMPLSEVLAQMESYGIRLDLKLLKDLSVELEERLIKLIEDIYALSGSQFNINSPKQLRQILFEVLKLPIIKRTKTGPSTDEEVLKALAGSHKLPALLLEYRQLTKLKSTYVDALPQLADGKGIVHTSFNQTATETGRLSSTNPNLQNIPIKTEIGSRIRQAVVPFVSGSLILSCDYSQIELRILAHISGDETLIKEFKENKDVHKATAALIYGVAEKDVTDPMRATAKTVNFGIVYGLTSYGLSKELAIPVDTAQSFIDSYFLHYPRIKEYISAQIEKASKDGFVTTILGRRRYIADINNKNQTIRQLAQRQAVNTPIQGSASDLIKLAMIRIQKDIKEKGFASKMILQIHDELVFDVPSKEMGEFSDLVKDRMENVMELDVPVRVSVKKGENWLNMEEIK